ncbi:uncharacterized protein LOC105735823 isoform X3 [Apis florea]|uniref:uncharacterized protein LOC105735823 isoform X3 n=1 Tax=Apis florea TaxID=7463 RepID=UPI0012FEC2A4|nr:uncharacterized protein LOC105735823 isoform X3 [Apis florea]
MTWETSTLKEDYDNDVSSQLTEKKLDTLCNICGFYVDCTALKKICSEEITCFTQENHEKSSKVLSSIDSKNSNFTSDIEEKLDISTSNHVSNFSSQLERTCDQYEAIVEIYDKYKSYTKCFECSKVSKICTKCSIINQILQKLKD